MRRSGWWWLQTAKPGGGIPNRKDWSKKGLRVGMDDEVDEDEVGGEEEEVVVGEKTRRWRQSVEVLGKEPVRSRGRNRAEPVALGSSRVSE